MDKAVDVLIVGGGLIGATLMLALQSLGLETCLVESKPLSQGHMQDGRTIALSLSSQRIFEGLGCWASLQTFAEPVKNIHVSAAKHFGQAKLCGKEGHPLGYVLPYDALLTSLQKKLALEQCLSPASCTRFNPVTSTATIQQSDKTFDIKAQLIIAADGANSSIRQAAALPVEIKNYHQRAITATVKLARTHDGWAYERFLPRGLLAFLPKSRLESSFVWAVPNQEADKLQTMPDDLFLTHLQTAFGYRLGRFLSLSKRFVFPIQQMIMPIQSQNNILFIGNAARTLHPIAAQGFNLGLRDVAMLVQCIKEYGLDALMLSEFKKRRQHDQTYITQLTDGLVHLFAQESLLMTAIRSLSLVAFDNIPVMSNLLKKYASGYGGVVPDLMCGLPLDFR